MSRLWIFNPDNDIALGNNLSHFTPPRHAKQLRENGAMILSWIADDGDYILGSSHLDFQWLEAISFITKKKIKIFTPRDINSISELRPWGWSRAIVSDLCKLGLRQDLMPDNTQIDKIRQLSHRRSSVKINQLLKKSGLTAQTPIEIDNINDLQLLLNKGYPYVIKSPWSSSGRGVMYSDSMNCAQTLKLSQGIIHNQGSILVERKLNKIIDFAMLFNIDKSDSKYVGLSVFNTSAGGNYAGNMIGSEHFLNQILTRYIGSKQLENIKNNLEQVLSELISGAYTGVCGVDMMIHLVDNKYEIAPCVELNLRNTMGYVAHCLGTQIIAPGRNGLMTIKHIGNHPLKHCPKPIFDYNSHLYKGSIDLIPINNQFEIKLTI